MGGRGGGGEGPCDLLVVHDGPCDLLVVDPCDFLVIGAPQMLGLL